MSTALVVGALVAMSFVVGGRGTARAADNGAWSVFPTTAPGGKPRLFFLPLMRAGEKYSDSVTITNKTALRRRMNVYAADALLTPQGTFSLRRRTDPKVGVAAWVKLPFDVVDLGPSSQLVVPFTIEPPRDAPSGDLLGGIVVEATTGSFAQSGQVGVSVLQAVGARIYARVAGPLHPALRVEHMHLSARSSLAGAAGGPVDLTLTFIVRNTGNQLLTPLEQSTIEPLFGGSRTSKATTLPQLPPGAELEVVHAYKGVEPYLDVRARVRVNAAGVTATGATSVLVVPWILVVILFALFVYGGYRFWRRRARPKPPGSAAPTGDGEGEGRAIVEQAGDVPAVEEAASAFG